MTSLHLLFVVLALIVYVVTSRASHRRRAPAAAIAWVFAIVVLPYLMLPLYLLFGGRKARRCESLPLVPPEPRHWATDILASFGVAPPGEAEVHFHPDGARAQQALWSMIDGARERIDIATFLVGDDRFGRELANRIALRVRDGIAVRVLIDGVGALLDGRGVRGLLLAAGADVRAFRPPLRLSVHPLSNLRNHRKAVIVDGRLMWAGGRNLSAHYFPVEASQPPWIDLSFDVRGAPVTRALAQFDQDWSTTPGPESHVHVPVAPGRLAGASACAADAVTTGPRGCAQFVPSGPDQGNDTLYSVLLAGTYRAERSMRIVTPYFVIDEALKEGLRLAALRGVDVTIVLPRRSNHRIADWARSRALRELAAAGVRARCVEGMLHAKAVVIDDTLCMCGSANFDVRSLLLNYESTLLCYSAREIDWLSRWIDDVARSAAACELPAPGLLRDLGEGLLIAIAFEL